MWISWAICSGSQSTLVSAQQHLAEGQCLVRLPSSHPSTFYGIPEFLHLKCKSYDWHNRKLLVVKLTDFKEASCKYIYPFGKSKKKGINHIWQTRCYIKPEIHIIGNAWSMDLKLSFHGTDIDPCLISRLLSRFCLSKKKQSHSLPFYYYFFIPSILHLLFLFKIQDKLEWFCGARLGFYNCVFHLCHAAEECLSLCYKPHPLEVLSSDL